MRLFLLSTTFAAAACLVAEPAAQSTQYLPAIAEAPPGPETETAYQGDPTQFASPTIIAGVDTCGMTPFKHLIGTPAAEIDRASLPSAAVVVPYQSAVTPDLRPERLVISTGADGNVTRMVCG